MKLYEDFFLVLTNAIVPGCCRERLSDIMHRLKAQPMQKTVIVGHEMVEPACGISEFAASCWCYLDARSPHWARLLASDMLALRCVRNSVWKLSNAWLDTPHPPPWSRVLLFFILSILILFNQLKLFLYLIIYLPAFPLHCTNIIDLGYSEAFIFPPFHFS